MSLGETIFLSIWPLVTYSISGNLKLFFIFLKGNLACLKSIYKFISCPNYIWFKNVLDKIIINKSQFL